MNEERTPGRRAAIRFIFATALMDSISLGIMIPVLPNLVKEFAHGDTAQAALWSGVFSTTWAFMQFVSAPLIGLLSDRFGRRPVLLVSIGGLGIDFLFMAMAPNLPFLFVGRVINGITSASFSTAGAYVTDITSHEKRAQAFGLLGAAFGAGFVIGPALGGFLGDINLRLPFYVAAAMALTNWLYGYFVLPESLPPERRVSVIDWSRGNPLGALRLMSSKPGLLSFGGIVFFVQLAHNVLPSVFVLYVGYRYAWSPFYVGLSMMGTGVAMIIVQGFLVKRTVRALGERRTLLMGLLCGALGFAIWGLAPTAALYWVGLPFFAGMGFVNPSLMGLMSRRVEQNQQGQLQGASASIQGLTGLIGPSLYTGTFAWAVHRDSALHVPGLPVLIASLLLLVGFLWALRVARQVPA